MHIQLNTISKRYHVDWIIKDLSYTIESQDCLAVSGMNGSGKSTLLKMLCGYLSPSEGSINYNLNGKNISRADVHQHMGIVAPYTDLIQEFDLREMFHFHTQFRSLERISSFKEFRELVRMSSQDEKPLQHYSSGMKQRVELALALLSDTSLLLLDEPTAYLDRENKDWFYSLLSDQVSKKTLVISSNDEEDFQFCKKALDLTR